MSETLADRRLHSSSIWLGLVRKQLAPWLVPAAVFIYVNLHRSDGAFRILTFIPFAALVMTGITLGVIFSYLAWSRFRYGVGEADIVIESGLINRVRRSIPLSRVQDVNIEQGPLQRLFGVAKVKIETGGGAKDEGLLNSVSLEEAERLRRVIRGGAAAPERPTRAPATAAVDEAPEGRLVFQLTPGRLALASLFSFSLVYLAAAFAVWQAIGNVLPGRLRDPRTWWGFAEHSTPIQAVEFIALLIVLGIVAGAARSVLRDYGFKLWKEGRRMRRERGLLTRSQVVVPLPRIQLAQVRTSPVRRLFGWFEVTVQTLGGAIDDAQGRQSIAPFATGEEVGVILAEAGPFRLPQEADLTRVSSRSLWKKLAPLLIPSGAIAIVSVFIPPVALLFAFILILGALTALEWNHYRYATADGLLFVRDGFLRQRLWIAPPASAQVIGLRQSPFQRLFAVVSVVVDTAGAGTTEPLIVQDLREERARELIDFLRAGSKPAAPPPRRRSRRARKPPP